MIDGTKIQLIITVNIPCEQDVMNVFSSQFEKKPFMVNNSKRIIVTETIKKHLYNNCNNNINEK